MKVTHVLYKQHRYIIFFEYVNWGELDLWFNIQWNLHTTLSDWLTTHTFLLTLASFFYLQNYCIIFSIYDQLHLLDYIDLVVLKRLTTGAFLSTVQSHLVTS